MRRSPICWCLVLVLCFISVAGFAQGTSATIVGTVVDPQKAVVAGAKITAPSTGTGLERSTNSTSTGDFTIPNLPPGVDDWKVKAKGFANGQSKAIKLNVGANLDLNFKLTVAGSSQTVDVTAAAPLIETTKTEVSSSVTDLDMQRLPTIAGAGGVANDYAQLALTAPGVKLDTSGLTTDLIPPASINTPGTLSNLADGNITHHLSSAP